MQLNTITIKALAACALLAAPALARAVPEPEFNPQSSALDLTVKFWDTTKCKTSGPKRQYNSGTCLPLPESTHAVSIQDKRAGCYMIRYEGGNCDGHGEKIANLDDCYNLGDRWYSLEFRC